MDRYPLDPDQRTYQPQQYAGDPMSYPYHRPDRIPNETIHGTPSYANGNMHMPPPPASELLQQLGIPVNKELENVLTQLRSAGVHFPDFPANAVFPMRYPMLAPAATHAPLPGLGSISPPAVEGIDRPYSRAFQAASSHPQVKQEEADGSFLERYAHVAPVNPPGKLSQFVLALA
jgi:hypothetical protein